MGQGLDCSREYDSTVMFIIYHCGCLLTYTYIYVYIFHHAKTRSLRAMKRVYEYSSKNFAPTLFTTAAEKSRTSKIAKIKRALLCTVHTYSKNILILSLSGQIECR